MNTINPHLINVEYEVPYNSMGPLDNRKYTIKHTDNDQFIQVTVGNTYKIDRINDDEHLLFAELIKKRDIYQLNIYINIGDIDPRRRNYNYRKLLAPSIQSIEYSDSYLFHVGLNQQLIPINVYFNSRDPEYNTVEYLGTLNEYIFKSISNC